MDQSIICNGTRQGQLKPQAGPRIRLLPPLFDRRRRFGAEPTGGILRISRHGVRGYIKLERDGLGCTNDALPIPEHRF